MRIWIACLAASAAIAVPAALPAQRPAHTDGEAQRRLLLERLERTAARIERDRRDGVILSGQADFMVEDLTRIWTDTTRIIENEGAIGPAGRASYAAMLRRVEGRLDAAEATHAPARPVTRRSVRK